MLMAKIYRVDRVLMTNTYRKPLLPAGLEYRVDHLGRKYYIDHVTRKKSGETTPSCRSLPGSALWLGSSQRRKGSDMVLG